MTYPYVYRWDRQGRKGQRCEVLARSRPARGEPWPLAFGAPGRPRFNSILVRFEDGYSMITSGNAIRRAK